jgi:pyridoxine kinase
MTILSFQSRVTFGCVGNAAAQFCLQRLGREVWPVDTVWFSNHPGHGRFTGRVRGADEIGDIIDGLDDLGVLPRTQAVLSGYLGTAALGGVLLATVARVRARAPAALFCCDPVMGDRESGVYVEPGLVAFFRDCAVAAADILTPNLFELELLAGRRLPGLAAVTEAARGLMAAGPRLVLVSSIDMAGIGPGCIATLAVARDGGGWLVHTPRLPVAAKGAGDILAAVFLARLLDQAPPADALAHAVAATYAVIAATPQDSRELSLIAAQASLADPPPLTVQPVA